MNKLATALLVLSFVSIGHSQTASLMIRGYGKDLYLEHKVAAHEGIYGIGRLYNVHPKFIAAYNKLDMTKGLSIGQVLRIPLTDTNFSQSTAAGKPIYYLVGEKETLAKISSVHNKVPPQRIREWNKLRNDNLAKGTPLIIGFLVPGSGAVPVATTPAKEEPKKPDEQKLVVKKDSADKTKLAIKKEETRKPEDTKTAIRKDSADKAKAVVKKEETKKPAPVVPRPEVSADMSGQGYFKAFFDQQVRSNPISKTETVTSGIFRMLNTSPEAKYYMLLDGVTPGTVVRVINPENNRAVYAKVLGEMGSARQNGSLNIRISDAAASSLGVADTDKFIVKINY